MDFFLALFPWFVLWNLNIKRKERITICVSLSLGIMLVSPVYIKPHSGS
jgi:hypothetical protein